MYQSQLQQGHTPPSPLQLCMEKHPVLQGSPHPLRFQNIEGKAERVGNSVCNRAEAEYIVQCLEQLQQDPSLGPGDIGVITPYKAQSQLLQQMIESDTTTSLNGLDIGTVHKFQGSERKVIVVSTVRSGNIGTFDLRQDLGFVAHKKMANVTVSRAQAALIVVGNMQTLSHHLTWNKMIREAVAVGALHGLPSDQLITLSQAQDSLKCVPSGNITAAGAHPHGYVFVCDNATKDECLHRGLFGLPASELKHMQQHIVKETICFLYNRDEESISGPFYALDVPQLDIVPSAFGQACAAQVQVRHEALGTRKRNVSQKNGGVLDSTLLSELLADLERHKRALDTFEVRSFEQIMAEKQKKKARREKFYSAEATKSSSEGIGRYCY